MERLIPSFIVLWSVVFITQILLGRISDDATELNTSFNVPGQGPYGGTPWPLPGTIQAEEFDEGGEGVAKPRHSPEDRGGQYRANEAVDIWRTSGMGGGYYVNSHPHDEWLEYTVDLEPGRYDISVRMVISNSFDQLEGNTFYWDKIYK